MQRTQFAAMGTTVSLLLPVGQAQAGAGAVRTLFDAWERALSRFQPDSELSRLNRRAGEPVAASPLLYGVIAAALNAARATDGLYDPTLLYQMEQVGYDRSFDALPARAPENPRPAAPGGGWRGLHLEPARRRVTLPAGSGLDLGGLAKGLAVDAAMDRLCALGIRPALIDAGGDLAVRGRPPHDTVWAIAVPGRDQAWTIPLQYGAMATSDIARRHWQQGPHQRHHLLDPCSGLPAQGGLWSATAVAARCAQADVGAKVAFILGPERGARFLQSHGLAGLLVEETGRWHAVGSWPVAAMEAAV